METYLFTSWDRISENELAQVVQEAIAPLFPDDPPRFMERIPHGYSDTARIASDIAAGGFGSNVRIETVALRSRARSARDAATAYCMGTPLRDEIEARGGRLENAIDVAEAALARMFGTGAIHAKMQAFVVTAARQAPRAVVPVTARGC